MAEAIAMHLEGMREDGVTRTHGRVRLRSRPSVTMRIFAMTASLVPTDLVDASTMGRPAVKRPLDRDEHV